MNENENSVKPELEDENLSPADEQENSSVELENGASDNTASDPSTEEETKENLSRPVPQGQMAYNKRRESRDRRYLDQRFGELENRVLDAMSQALGQQGSAQPTEVAQPEQKGNLSYADVQNMVKQELQDRKKQEVQQGEQKIDNAFLAKANAMSDKFEDFDDVIEDLTGKGHITTTMVNSMKYDPDSVDALYKVGKENPQLLENISKLSPMQQGVEVGKLMAGFAKPNQAPIKPAPHKPLSPVNNSGGSMSKGGNNYAFDDRLAELAAGLRKSR